MNCTSQYHPLGFLRFKKLKEEFMTTNSHLQSKNNQSIFLKFFESIYEAKKRYDIKGRQPLSPLIGYKDSPSTNDTESGSTDQSHESNNPYQKPTVPDIYTIHIEKVLSNTDKRTTIMLRNIPNKIKKEVLLELINQHFRGKFDVLCLPLDFKVKKNYGYAFINFTESMHVVYLYYLFHGKKWKNTNSQKICEVTYSKFQGKAKLVKHYPRNSIISNKESTLLPPTKADTEVVIPKEYANIFLASFPCAIIRKHEDIFVITNMNECSQVIK